jgi:hypothetical protein
VIPTDKVASGYVKGLVIHGFVHVLPHPIFAVADKNGYFALPKLPDGDYELVAIHELLGKVTKKVMINGRSPKPVTIGTTHYAGDRSSAGLLPVASAVWA